ncbi:M14 family metallopeptidase, partial [Microbacterium sp. DT81.1]
MNVDEVESALENLAAAYPSLATLIELPHATHEGRRSRVLKVGTADPLAEGILLLGGMHAREWVPPDALVSLAADLLEAYDSGTGLAYGGANFTSADVRRVMETVHVYFYACVNPDGRRFSQNSDPMWRKNRRPHPSGGACVGVDLNRNFDFLWDHLTKFAPDSGVSASDDPCNANVYRGPSPASEPETRNVMWMLDTAPHIRWHIDVHSAVPVILHNWGSDQNQTAQPAENFLNAAFDGVRGRRDDGVYGEFIPSADLGAVTAMSARMNDAVRAVRGDDYGFEQAYSLYPTSGASDDYAYSRSFADAARPTVYGFTIECGHSFQPTWAEAEEVIREVSAGMIAFGLAVAERGAGPAEVVYGGKDIALVRQTPGWAS